MLRISWILGLFGLVTFFYFAKCQNEFEAGQTMEFGQKVDHEAIKMKIAEGINTTEKRKLLFQSPDKKPMAVYDKLFEGSIILTLRSYLTTLGQDSWLFNNYDPDHSTKQRTSDNVPWVNYRNPTEFNKMLVCKTLVKAITDLTGKKEEWFPYKVTGKVLRRGDHTKVVADSNNTDEFSVLIYLNSKWRKNHYGELYFFDDEKEIMQGITPKPGRVVIWDSSLLRLTRPPSISQKQGQVLLHIIFSKSKQRMMEEHDKWLSFWNDKLEAKKNFFLPDYEITEDKPLVPNVADHVVANYSTSKGDRLYVFDNLFPVELLDHVRAYVLKYGTYFYDDSIDSESDNVQWIAGHDMYRYIESPYWKIIKAVAKFATGSPEWFPYDVSTNLIRNADHTRIHLDTSGPDDKEWTFLVYLNPNWTRNDYGETAFFERNSDDTEIVAEVRPRYGRAVIFQGQIPHSARPPSLNFTGARLTFVTKLQQSEYHGRMKNLEEEFRHFQAHSGSVESLDSLVQTGNTDGYLQRMQAIRSQAKKYKAQVPENAPQALPEGAEGSEPVEEGQEPEEGAEKEPEEGAEREPEEGTEEGAEGVPEEGEDAPLEGRRGQGGASRGNNAEDGPEEDEEEEQVSPEVKYVQEEMGKIKEEGKADAAKVARLYKEMKARDANLLLVMSEKFPTML